MSAEDERGLVAGRYQLGERLGRGGMADVYEAHDVRLERSVAVKVLRRQLAADADLRARFEVEARAAARLSHPNVVAVFDTGEHDGLPFMVMERLPGSTLADRVQAGPLSADDARRIAGDVLGALAAAHAAGIVHRDVKPGNILLTDDGCAKVSDFGIAKSLEAGRDPDLTATGILLGTPAYLAPERIDGEPANPRSDLYSLGVVLYEGLAGRKPFTGATPVAVANAIKLDDPSPLAELRPDLDPALVGTIDRAMRKDPAERFSSADEMAAALGVVPSAELTVPMAVSNPDTTAVAPAVPLAAAVWWRRRPALVGLAVVALVLLAALAGALSPSGGRGGGEADAEELPGATVATVATTSAPTTTTAAPVRTEPVTGADGDRHDDDDDDEEPRRGGGKGAGKGASAGKDDD